MLLPENLGAFSFELSNSDVQCGSHGACLSWMLLVDTNFDDVKIAKLT